MELRVRPAHISELIERFNELSQQPSSPENTVRKLEPITEAVTLCLKYNTQLRQAQRVAIFLADVMGDPRQEETVHMVASMAYQTMLNHIQPVEAIADKPLRKTRRWVMGSAPQRVHAAAISRAVRLHADSAQMRLYVARTAREEAKNLHPPIRSTPYGERKRLAKEAELAAGDGKPRHRRWEKGALLAKSRPN